MFIKKSKCTEVSTDIDINDRLKYSTRLINKYRDCVPVIIKKNINDKILQDIDKEKYLIPKNLNLSEVLISIRKRIKLDSNKAIFIFVGNGVLAPLNRDMLSIYNEYRSEDNFLYMVYTTENTFG